MINLDEVKPINNIFVDIKTLDECIGNCIMCKHARYYEWAEDINDFYCDLEDDK